MSCWLMIACLLLQARVELLVHNSIRHSVTSKSGAVSQSSRMSHPPEWVQKLQEQSSLGRHVCESPKRPCHDHGSMVPKLKQTAHARSLLILVLLK
jgi:hypothetical protein